jgi:hypothetical protein
MVIVKPVFQLARILRSARAPKNRCDSNFQSQRAERSVVTRRRLIECMRRLDHQDYTRRELRNNDA